MELSRVPQDWPRSPIEQYFLTATVLRRANPNPTTAAVLLDGIRALHGSTASFPLQARCNDLLDKLRAAA